MVGSRIPRTLHASIVPVVGVIFLAVAPQAIAKHYRISSANETFQIEPDGSIQATERPASTREG
jgi:hypothetical protein